MSSDTGVHWVSGDECHELWVGVVFLGRVARTATGTWITYNAIRDTFAASEAATEAEAQQDVEYSVRQSVTRIAEALGVVEEEHYKGYTDGFIAGVSIGRAVRQSVVRPNPWTDPSDPPMPVPTKKGV